MIFTVACYGYTTFLPGCELLPLSPCSVIHFGLLRFVGEGGCGCGCDNRIRNDTDNPILGWDLGTFFSYYTMVFVCPILYLGWKIVWKTKIVRAEEADLVCFSSVPSPIPCPSPTHSAQPISLTRHPQVWERPIIDAYEANTLEPHFGFWQEVKIMMGFGKKGVGSASEF